MSIVGWVLDALDALLDDHQYRERVAIRDGLALAGRWRDRTLTVQGAPLEPSILADYGENPPAEFCWGDGSEASRLTALAVMLWLLPERRARHYADRFHRDVVADLPQADFDRTVPYERWRNRLIARRSGTAQPTGDHLAEMGGSRFAVAEESASDDGE
ncbi:DUF6166 domain-containing protein [Haloarculaceae archaeon H-GB11]|nr:DUF6166 domain-containing protein [Haloarculaceae archaeon H-GB11]